MTMASASPRMSPGQPDIHARQDCQVDGQSQPDEGHDLRQPGQCRMKSFDLTLVRRAAVADDDAGYEDCEKAGSVQQCGPAVDA